MVSPPKESFNNKIATLLAIVITVAWAISFFVDIFVLDYNPSASVHALMMMVAGAVFGEGLIKTRSFNGGSSSNKGEETNES